MVETPRLDPTIRCKGLAKSFGGRTVLKNVSCDLMPGEVLAIMGLSGSGKSTFLRLLALLERSDAGEAWLGGQQYLAGGVPVANPVQVRRRVSMVFQQFNLFPNLTILDNCTLGPIRSLHVLRRDAERSATELLETFGLAALIHRFPETLSGGEAQRIAVARALLMRPQVLLLDEITSSLDPENILKVLNTLRAIRSLPGGGGTAIILVTHLLPFAQSFATRIAYLDNGALVDMLPADAFADGASSVAAQTFIRQSHLSWTADTR
jgi:ABC-type polar amino acid transport system ATPase subunit